MQYPHRTGDLIQKMVDEGICKTPLSAKMFLYRLTSEKKLTLPTLPNSRHRRMTAKQIDEIIRELLPGGSGQWHFRKEVDYEREKINPEGL